MDYFKVNDTVEHSYSFHIITYEYRKTEICYQTQIFTSQKSMTENINNIRIYSLKCQNCSTELFSYKDNSKRSDILINISCNFVLNFLLFSNTLNQQLKIVHYEEANIERASSGLETQV